MNSMKKSPLFSAAIFALLVAVAGAADVAPRALAGTGFGANDGDPGLEASRLELAAAQKTAARKAVARQPHGNGAITVSGELKQWHKVTLNLAGPFAAEPDTAPNPFTDYRLNVTFTHSSGSPAYNVPGYFAADGNAANTSATAGTVWRAHLSPDKAGTWTYLSLIHI
jgi:hypothetical protein